MKKYVLETFRQTYQFGQKNWFIISLILIILYAFFRKDLSLAISFNSPEKIEKKLVATPAKIQKKEDIKNSDKKDSWSIMDINPFSSTKNINPYAALEQMETTTIIKYINRFQKVCVAEGEKYGIPAHIILANSILMSQAGTAKISHVNNQFNLKCSEGQPTKSYSENGICYKSYDSAWLSYRDFSIYVSILKAKQSSDAFSEKEWIAFLNKNIYMDVKNYQKSINQIIEKYKLNFISTNA